MIHFVFGDMFEQYFDIRVNTVNCVGKMGKGIALQFKQRYSDMFEAYATQCQQGKWKPGFVHLWHAPTGEFVLNAATKDDWRNGSQLEWVEECAKKIAFILRRAAAPIRIAVPPMGCGNGGLSWCDARLRIWKHLHPVHDRHQIYLFQPRTIVTNIKNKEEFDVYIGRLSDTPEHWGNPASHIPGSRAVVKVETRAEAIQFYDDWLDGRHPDVEADRRRWVLQSLPFLWGKRLGCNCTPLSCHGHSLAKRADYSMSLGIAA